MVDNPSRNNWIIFIVVIAAGVMISLSVLQVYSMAIQFQTMITDVANHIDHVVNQTAQNMTALTVVLIEQQKASSINLEDVVDNQTREFVGAVGNFTNIISNYSDENDQNLNKIYNLLNRTLVNNTTG